MAVAALILAGGRGSRMGGVDKTQLVVDGSTIFERQRAVLAPRVDPIMISAATEPPPWAHDLPVVLDLDTIALLTDVSSTPHAAAHLRAGASGPLLGIVAGLAVCADWLLVIAGDLPDLQPALIELLLAGADAEHDAVACRIGGRAEPLCALYRRTALPRLFDRLVDGELGVAAALDDPRLAVRWLDEAAVRAVDPMLKSFHNLNEPADLAALKDS